MKRLLCTLTAVFLSLQVNAAQKTTAELLTEISALFPTNGVGSITAANLRQVTEDIVDSYFNLSAPVSANLVLAGPTMGAADLPTYRALVGADLPVPSASTLGGIQSVLPVSNQWINSISTSGIPSLSQPAFSNISGSLSLSQVSTSIDNLTNCTDQGSVLYRNGSTWVCLAPNTSGKFLTTGGAGVNPSWSVLTPTQTANAIDTLTSCTDQGSIVYRNASTWLCLAPGTAGQVLRTNGAAADPSWAGGTSGSVTSVTCGTYLTGGTFTTTGTCAADAASASDYNANTANKVLNPNAVWTAAGIASLTDAATIAVDMSTGFNFSVTLGGNRTLGNPTNTKVGQTGIIKVSQDGTGSRTLAFASNYKFSGGTACTLTTTASRSDYLVYFVFSATEIAVSCTLDVR